MATRVGSSRRRCPANAGTAVPTTPAVTTDDSSTAFVTRRMSSPSMSGRPRSRRAIPSHAPEASGRSEIQGTIGRSVSSRPPRWLETRGQTSAHSSLARSTEPLRRARAPTEPVGRPVDRLPLFEVAGPAPIVASAPAPHPGTRAAGSWRSNPAPRVCTS